MPCVFHFLWQNIQSIFKLVTWFFLQLIQNYACLCPPKLVCTLKKCSNFVQLLLNQCKKISIPSPPTILSCTFLNMVKNFSWFRFTKGDDWITEKRRWIWWEQGPSKFSDTNSRVFLSTVTFIDIYALVARH